MKLNLRPTTPSDEEFARRVHHAAYRNVVIKQFGNWDETLQDQFFDETWNRNNCQIVLADGQPCGWLCVDRPGSKIWVREILLLPEFQGRGIGAALLRDLISEANQQGVPIGLQVLHKNPAVRLYARLGFKPVGRTDTHLLMEIPVT